MHKSLVAVSVNIKKRTIFVTTSAVISAAAFHSVHLWESQQFNFGLKLFLAAHHTDLSSLLTTLTADPGVWFNLLEDTFEMKFEAFEPDF